MDKLSLVKEAKKKHKSSNTLFFDLSPIGLKGDMSPFSLLSFVYEEEIAKRNSGIDLSSTKSLGTLKGDNLEHYENLVPNIIFYSSSSRKTGSLESLAQKYEAIEGPCSMLLNNVEELEEHILKIYQVSYAHYILGKKEIPHSSFPKGYCGVSSKNIMLSLMEHGYPNAACANKTMESKKKQIHSHSYTILPFIIKNNNLAGTIIIDPTSDQLWKTIKEKPRNYLFVALGTKWKYKTEFCSGLNLFPTGIINLDSIKNLMYNIEFAFIFNKNHYKNTKQYLLSSFSNPIDIKDFKN
jgi:hypothetical protein